MVIWVDRVKCWMYQADVDFTRILESLTGSPPAMWHDDEFFRELNQGLVDFQGPLFGESAVPERPANAAANTSGVSTASSPLPSPPSLPAPPPPFPQPLPDRDDKNETAAQEEVQPGTLGPGFKTSGQQDEAAKSVEF
jgi:hypothetical protein